MTFFAVLNLISIVFMIATVGYLSYIIAEMRYSLYYIAVRSCFYRDNSGVRWLRKHSYYFWYNVLMFATIAICLATIGQFMKNDIFNKPILTFVAYAALWVSFFFVIRASYKRIRQ